MPTTLNATRSDFDIDLELSFRPSISFEVELDIIVVDASIGLTVGLDVPKLDVEIKQVHNVNSTCDPAPASLSPNQVYPNLTTVVPKIGFDMFEVINESASFFGINLHAQQPFNQSPPESPLPTECSFFDQAKGGMGPVPATKPLHLSPVSSAMQAHMPLTAALLAIGMVLSIM